MARKRKVEGDEKQVEADDVADPADEQGDGPIRGVWLDAALVQALREHVFADKLAWLAGPDSPEQWFRVHAVDGLQTVLTLQAKSGRPWAATADGRPVELDRSTVHLFVEAIDRDVLQPMAADDPATLAHGSECRGNMVGTLPKALRGAEGADARNPERWVTSEYLALREYAAAAGKLKSGGGGRSGGALRTQNAISALLSPTDEDSDPDPEDPDPEE